MPSIHPGSTGFEISFSGGSPPLLPFHKSPDFIVTADEQEDYVVLELKKDAVFKSRADFPVVTLPVLEAESFGQRRQTVKIVH